ncbi:MAG: hypothetical protein M3142_01575 [Bacteroidota bacterium]|nr:hypothetical protein [Bacteroidota bacterium]
MKIILYLFIAFVFCGVLTSCEDDEKIYQPKTEDVPQIFPKKVAGKDIYDLNNLGTNPAIAFRIDLDARGVEIASVEVYKTLDAAVTFTPRILHTTLTTFPAEVNIPINDAITGIEIEDDEGNPRPLAITDLGTSEDYEDTFIFTFEIVRKDGKRIIYTPVDPDGYLLGSPQIFEPYSFWAPIRAL